MATGFGRSRSRRPTTREGSCGRKEVSTSDIRHWSDIQRDRAVPAVTTTTVDAMPAPPPQGVFRSRSRSKSRSEKPMETLRPVAKEDIHLLHTHTPTTSKQKKAAKDSNYPQDAAPPHERTGRPPLLKRQPTAAEDIGMALGDPRKDPVVLAPPRQFRTRKDSAASAWTGSSTTQGGQSDGDDWGEVEPKISRWKSLGGLFSRKPTPASSSPPPAKAQFFRANDPAPVWEYDPAPVFNGPRGLPTPPASPPEAKSRPSLNFMGRSRAASKASVPSSSRDSTDVAPSIKSTKSVKPSRKNTLKRLRKSPKPKPAPPIEQEQIPDLQYWAPPTLDIEIPNVQLERYSVMFGSLLNPGDRSSLLARRKVNVEKLDKLDRLKPIVEDDTPALSPPRRPASSPPATGKHSPTFSLFPSTNPSTTAAQTGERDRSRSNPGPSPLCRAMAAAPGRSETPMLIEPARSVDSSDGIETRDSNLFFLTIQHPPEKPASTSSRTASPARRRPSPSPPRHLSAFPPAYSSSPSSRTSSKTRRRSPVPARHLTPSPQLIMENHPPPATPPPSFALPAPPLLVAGEAARPSPLKPQHQAPTTSKPRSTPSLTNTPGSNTKRSSLRQRHRQTPSPSPTRAQRAQRPPRPPRPQRPSVYEPLAQHPHNLESSKQDNPTHDKATPAPLKISQSAAELSIARQISVSQCQRAALRLEISASPPNASAPSAPAAQPHGHRTRAGENKGLTPTLVDFGDGGVLAVGDRRKGRSEKERKERRERERERLAARRSELGLLESA